MRGIRLALALVGALGAPAGAAEVPAELDSRAARRGSARVIVTIARDAGGLAPLLARLGETARARMRHAAAGGWVAFDATPGDLAALRTAPEAGAVIPDRLLRPDLDVSVPLVGAQDAADAGWVGAGVAVAVIDTGVDGTHPFLAGRIAAEACFSGGGDCPDGSTAMLGPGAGAPCAFANACFHGTHVAGIAAGSLAPLHGVARGADVVALQVFSEFRGGDCAGTGQDPCALAYTSDMIAALEHVAELTATLEVAAVNMSLGGGLWSDAASCDADPANAWTKLAIDALRSLGIPTAASSGNDGATNAMSAPGCISTTLAVGASDDADAVWPGSNVSPDLDLLAPGVSITSSAPPGFYGASWLVATGTSMAAPHVAGALALLRAADPGASVAALEAALASTGTPVFDARMGRSVPRLAADLAIKSLGRTACWNALDDDLDGATDFPADPQCSSGLDGTEANVASCGLGPELVLLAPLFWLARRRVRRPAG